MSPGRNRGGVRLGPTDERGQSMVETVLSLSMLLVIVLGLLQLGLLAATRHVVNYAAFAGARASLYGNPGDGASAAQDVIGILGYSAGPISPPSGGSEFEVRYPIPFVLPVLKQGQPVVVVGTAPVFMQDDIQGGDNGG